MNAEKLARGQLAGILAQRRTEGLTDPGPYALLDPSDPTDQKIIGSLYASMVPKLVTGDV